MWVYGCTKGHTWEAQVFDRGSQFGINRGRVSRLTVFRGRKCRENDLVYQWDRGEVENKCGAEVVLQIVAECESMPVGK